MGMSIVETRIGIRHSGERVAIHCTVQIHRTASAGQIVNPHDVASRVAVDCSGLNGAARYICRLGLVILINDRCATIFRIHWRQRSDFDWTTIRIP